MQIICTSLQTDDYAFVAVKSKMNLQKQLKFESGMNPRVAAINGGLSGAGIESGVVLLQISPVSHL